MGATATGEKKSSPVKRESSENRASSNSSYLDIVFEKASQRYKLSKEYRQSMLKQLNKGQDPKKKIKKTSATMKPEKKAAKARSSKNKKAAGKRSADAAKSAKRGRGSKGRMSAEQKKRQNERTLKKSMGSALSKKKTEGKKVLNTKKSEINKKLNKEK